MKKETDINIDALLRDTFLTVVELRQGTTVRHGMELYLPAAGGTGPRTSERCRIQSGERGAHNLRAVRPAGRNGPEP